MFDHPNVRRRRVFRNLGQLVKDDTALAVSRNALNDYRKIRCAWCGSLFGHVKDCGLDMSAAGMTPGNAEVAALADRASGVAP